MSGEVIKVVYADFEAAITEINTEKGEMKETLEELRTRLDQLDWIGSGREAYEDKKVKWDASFNWLNTVLEGIASTGQLAREKYPEAEDGFVTVLSHERRMRGLK